MCGLYSIHSVGPIWMARLLGCTRSAGLAILAACRFADASDSSLTYVKSSTGRALAFANRSPFGQARLHFEEILSYMFISVPPFTVLWPPAGCSRNQQRPGSTPTSTNVSHPCQQPHINSILMSIPGTHLSQQRQQIQGGWRTQEHNHARVLTARPFVWPHTPAHLAGVIFSGRRRAAARRRSTRRSPARCACTSRRAFRSGKTRACRLCGRRGRRTRGASTTLRCARCWRSAG
ncbi:hypothetical protein BC827DRAFT_197683 [Russula dissimulans]|nr:hypothetical protein BC827DRAFT_197683 [Russula dissimulans]